MDTLDELIKKYKAHEVDFVLPRPEGDSPIFLDLYLFYESPEERWHKVQTIVYHYFNYFLNLYRTHKINSNGLIEKLYFPEVSWIALGHCKKGIDGRGTAGERAEIIKKFIFDDPAVQEVGIDAIAKMSIEIENIGPDVMSDMVANFGMHYLIEYTQEQVQSLNLKTAEFQVQRALDIQIFKWRPILKVQLPFFGSTGEPRILVPRHLVRKLPIFSTMGFFNSCLRHILRQEEEDRVQSLRTIGKRPRVSFEQVKEELRQKYGKLGNATRRIAKDRPELVEKYVRHPYLFKSYKKRKLKENVDWDSYVRELQNIVPGRDNARKYAEYLKKIFAVLYEGQLTSGKLEEKSEGNLFFYDISFANSAETHFFRTIRNQQVKAGVVILEAKNYRESELGNKEFNQSRAYTIVNGREFVLLATRKDITDADIQRARRHFLAQKCIIFPISDSDIIKLIGARRSDKEYFDTFLVERLQKILEA